MDLPGMLLRRDVEQTTKDVFMSIEHKERKEKDYLDFVHFEGENRGMKAS